MITTLAEAIKICRNEVRLIGVLSELNIDIIDMGDDINIKYKGVVDVNDSFIRFYGNISSRSTMYHSIINNLKELTAEIMTMANNGNIIETKYNHKASRVFIEGKLASHSSVNVTYIREPRLNETNAATIYVVGIVSTLDSDDKNVSDMDTRNIFILNSFYHQVLAVCITGDGHCPFQTDRGNVVSCRFELVSYLHGYPPIQCVEMKKVNVDIDKDIIEQAQKEHDIYIKSLEAWQK